MTNTLQTGTDTPKLNLDHPRIKNRTVWDQRYRDQLAKDLMADRKLGELGYDLAKDRLKSAKTEWCYILAKYGRTQKWYDKRIEGGSPFKLTESLHEFEGINIDHNKLAEILIKYPRFLAEKLDKLENPNLEIAQELIKAGFLQKVAGKLYKFENPNLEIAQELIKAGFSYAVVKYLHKFKGDDHKKIAEALIKAGEWSKVAENLEKFKKVDHNEIAKALIKAGEWSKVAENLEKFKKVDHNEIAKALIEAEEFEVLAENLHKFKNLDVSIGRILIEEGYADQVRENIKSFNQSKK